MVHLDDDRAERSLLESLHEAKSELDPWFTAIVRAGTGKAFETGDNSRWPEATRPILEAFFHARYFLEMAVRYACSGCGDGAGSWQFSHRPAPLD